MLLPELHLLLDVYQKECGLSTVRGLIHLRCLR